MMNELSICFLDKILPMYGNHRQNIPIYDSTQKMFLSTTYTSASGNMYYKGVRFSSRMVMLERVALYKNWTYIDEVEIYAFDGKILTVIGKKKFDKLFYNSDTIKCEVEELTFEYLKNQMILSDGFGTDETIMDLVNDIISEIYCNSIENLKQLPDLTRLMLMN